MSINLLVAIKVVIILSFLVLTECGRVKRVIGGVEVECGTELRVASLMNYTSSEHLCGVTILTPRFAITAAHCVHNIDKPQFYYIQLNNHCDRESLPRADVLQVIPHDSYNRASRAHDLALLRIKLYLDDVTWLDSDALPNSSFGISGDCKILGYGTKAVDSSLTSETLMAAMLRIISLDKCTEVLGPIAPAYNSGMMCAVGDGTDACQGDSGSPLMCQSKLHGLCSYGLSCGVRGVPGVYTSVGAHLRWIREILYDTNDQ